MADSPGTKDGRPKLLRVLDGEVTSPPPLWIMRQAGRYLPEYRAVRAGASSFLELCFTPHLAAEVTLQPIRRFGFDAAILFSDILVVPHALGVGVSFEEDGPRLEAMDPESGLARLKLDLLEERLAPVFEAIGRVRGTLSPDVALLGFCGAPWTVASYMVAGRGTPDQRPARLMAYHRPQAFQELIDLLVQASVRYLAAQFRAGVDAVQVFDSWAGALDEIGFRRWSLEPLAAIVAGVRREVPGARFIAFPRGAGHRAEQVAECVPVNALAIDWGIDLAFARDELQPKVAVQGNLDPLRLLAGGDSLHAEADRILEILAGGPLIFNLGHGILPDTPIAHVEALVRQVRS